MAECRRVRVSTCGGLSNDMYMRWSDGASRNVVFFPGDIQDFKHTMATQARAEHYAKFGDAYNIERTADLVASRFGGGGTGDEEGRRVNVFVVLPGGGKLNRGTLSLYSNLTTASRASSGDAPVYDPAVKAWRHLTAILSAACDELFADRNGGRGRRHMMMELPFVLVAFSRGCVVLNQLVTEMVVHEGKQTDRLDSEESESNWLHLQSLVREIHWLDSGNGNSHGSMPVAVLRRPEACERLRSAGVVFGIHGTPYQWGDARRRWLRDEKDEFVAHLRLRGADDVPPGVVVPVFERLYFPEAAAGSLDVHFSLLEHFDPRLDTAGDDDTDG